MHIICFTISFISCLHMFRAPCAHHQEVKIALHSLWYRHTCRCNDTRGQQNVKKKKPTACYPYLVFMWIGVFLCMRFILGCSDSYLLLPYLLTPCSTVLLEKLTSFQLVKKFPEFYGTWRFITTFTSARHLSLSWASSIHSIPPHPTS